MPNRRQFKSVEAYRQYYSDYRAKNREKLRAYRSFYDKAKRANQKEENMKLNEAALKTFRYSQGKNEVWPEPDKETIKDRFWRLEQKLGYSLGGLDKKKKFAIIKGII